MSNQLTAEQQRKIEENRRKALERRAQRLGQTGSINKHITVGFSITSAQIQSSKHVVAPGSATIAHRGDPASSLSAIKPFVPPFREESQTSNSQSQGLKQQQLSCSSNQNTPSALSTSAFPRQVRFVPIYLIT